MPDSGLDALLSVAKALSDPGRVRILALLGNGPLCVCQITELLELAPSTVSKHLSILKQARLIETEKDGRWIHCRLAEAGAPPVAGARKWVAAAVEGSARLREDRRLLRDILKLEPEEICRRQLKRQRTS
jgi:DNA-binding transcriptional ArsR family regulator